MAELLVTADELRDFLDVPVGDLDDTRAELLIGLISGLVLDHCNRATFTVTVEPETVLLDGTGTTVILLPAHPVVEVVEVIEDPRGDATELVEDVDFDWSAKGILTALVSRWRRRSRWYRVAYRHGYPETPEGVKLIVLRVAARAVTNPEGLATEGTPGYTAGFAFDATRLPTLSAPDRDDLEPYRIQVA